MGENSHLYFFRFFYVIIFENLNETSSKDFELKFFDENNWCVNISLVSIMKKVSIWKMVIPIAHTVFLFIYIWDYIYMCVFLVGIYLLTSICVWGGQILENGLVPKITLFLCFNFYEKN